jgi:hypothetical protein
MYHRQDGKYIQNSGSWASTQGHVGVLGMDSKIILTQIIKEYEMMMWNRLADTCLKMGCYEHSNEPLGSIKRSKFLD